MQCFNAVEINDCRAVNPGEFLRVEIQFNSTDSLADEISLFADVKLKIISRRADPIDVFGLNEDGLRGGFDDEPFKMFRFRLNRRQKLSQMIVQIARLSFLNLAFGAFDGAG
jgi:hypothetical protein